MPGVFSKPMLPGPQPRKAARLVLACCGAKLHAGEVCSCAAAAVPVPVPAAAAAAATTFNYNKTALQLASIAAFDPTAKNKNDAHNKLREAIVGAIVNTQVPAAFYASSGAWRTMRAAVWDYVHAVIGGSTPDAGSVSLVHRGGRKYHYDFALLRTTAAETTNYNIELKFNSACVDDTPQFVSPMRPSQYMSESYEEFFYDHYLPQLWTAMPTPAPLPDRATYLGELHKTAPACVAPLQTQYYKGAKGSSKYTGAAEDIAFWRTANALDNESRRKFIERATLDIQKLTDYLQETQQGKIYMLYKDGRFHMEQVNMDNYQLVSCVKNPQKYRFEVTSKTGNYYEILLRWKNGNGVAFPAFQIKSRAKPPAAQRKA